MPRNIFLMSILNMVLALNAHAENVNESLVEKAKTKISEVVLPENSKLVYQEEVASKSCMLAYVTQIYSVESEAAVVCNEIYSPLTNKGWKSFYGCQTKKYPFKKRPIDGNRESFEYANFSAGVEDGKFGISFSARPSNSLGLKHFELSEWAEQNAIPEAKKNGKAYFYLSYRYRESKEIYEAKCPENSMECECTRHSYIKRILGKNETVVRDQ